MADTLSVPTPISWFTAGVWATEAESAAAFDHHIVALDIFTIYREVEGTLMQPRPGQRDRAMRIDRILMPTRELLAGGWKHGAVGVEIKRSGINIGPPLSQAIDYTRGVWGLNGVLVHLGAVFLWPTEKQSGPLASLMVHNRIGTASVGYTGIKLCLGEEVILARDADGIRLGSRDSGHAVGSR